MSLPIVWSIAGSDSGAGAGLQADLRAFDAFGVHGCTAVAAITAQNSVAVVRAEPVAPELLDAQLAALAADLPPQAIKLGMLGSVENLRVVLRWVQRLREQAPLTLVVDPVWRASTGADLSSGELQQALRNELLPQVDALTPNRREAAWLLGCESLRDEREVEAAARELKSLGARSVVITGGDDADGEARDFLLSPQAEGWLALPRIDTRHTHGTGCTFAASVAAAAALGFCEADAAVLAKMATALALRNATPAGEGAGPVRAAAGFANDRSLLPTLTPAGAPAPSVQFPATGPEPLGLYAVVDSAEWVERVAAAGVPTVQLRIKQAPADVLDREVAGAVAAADRHGVRLFINDHWQLALRHKAYGVHLGQEDLQEANLQALAAAGVRLGLSTHSLWELARAHAVKPSYCACGPIYATQTKNMPWLPQGEHNLRAWCALAPAPVVAIGGLDIARAEGAARCGADGVAVLSGIVTANHPEARIGEYLKAVHDGHAAMRPAAPALPHPSLPH
jgi:hydroxymethylpyrimidine kinase/phosphomethylpyrimidine kinase/thiamine-phosphate diphosphorylase